MTSMERLIVRTKCEHIYFWAESLARSMVYPGIDELTKLTIEAMKKEIDSLEKFIEVIQ